MKRLFIIFLAAAFFQAGCRKDIPHPAAARPRVVSYSPALTEMLFDMGLGGHVVGVTARDILPADQSRHVVGDRNRVNAEAILAVEPDVILVQQNPEDFQRVLSVNRKIRLELFEIQKLDDVAAAMDRIGRIVGREEVGRRAAERFRSELQGIRDRAAGRSRPRVLFVMGYDRPFIGGAESFVNEIIELAGGIDAAGDYKRWSGVNAEYIIAAAPDVLICQVDAGQEYAARKYWMGMEGLPAARTGRVHVVTDRHWTIPSPRLTKIAAEAADIIHPQTREGDRGK